MADRQTEIDAFLQGTGWQDATRAPLAGDASARRYERLCRANGDTAVLMDAPIASGEDTTPFLTIARHLRAQGFSAPKILAADPAAGFLLLEDIGDDLFAVICADRPDLERPLYEAAVDLLVRMQSGPLPAGLLPYDLAAYIRESRLLTEWYLPGATGKETPKDLADAFSNLITDACAALTGDRTCLVLRDYHAENLLWLPDRKGVAQVGLLDFQDALLGHPAYDLVSLLRDARRDTSTELREAMLRRFLRQTGTGEAEFRQAFATLGVQRNLKIIGIFARLCRRDNKAAYVDLIPRVWAHLQAGLTHPALADLRDFVTRHVPEPDAGVLAGIRRGNHVA
jgi:N-acetylmuramate 1-kinase